MIYKDPLGLVNLRYKQVTKTVYVNIYLKKETKLLKRTLIRTDSK